MTEPFTLVGLAEETVMRVLTVATLLLLSSTQAPSIAQQQANPSAQSPPETGQPQTVPVQPERTPRQSEQSRAQEQKRGEDVQVGRDWRTQSRDGDHMGRMGENHMERMMDHMDRRMRHDMEKGITATGAAAIGTVEEITTRLDVG